MRTVVRAAFVPFSTRFEGCLNHMYLDVKGLCTTAIGVLIDPVELALGLPWKHPSGLSASAREIFNEWHAIKGRLDIASHGGGAFRKFTELHLDDLGIEQVVSTKLRQVDLALTKRFPGYQNWPADAQLGTLSMAWACGSAFHFPRLEAALSSLDFREAAAECHMDEKGNPGLKPRNQANVRLFLAAAKVVSEASSPDVLHYMELSDLADGLDDDTEPSIQPVPYALHVEGVFDPPKEPNGIG